MKKLTYLLISLCLLFVIPACNSAAKNAEEENSTKEFSELGNEEGFAESHNEPGNIDFEEKGERITFPVEGGEEASAYRIENTKETEKYLLVFHEWWGLNDHIKQEAERLFSKLGNVHVLALDLYDGKVAEQRELAQKYMQSADENRIKAIINASLKALPSNAEVATIGWCFGGGWSLKAAIQGGGKTRACVVYYGMPVKEKEELASLNSDVLFIYGKQDNWINEEVATTFQNQMTEMGKDVTILGFDADHAFANPSSDRYNSSAAQEANERAFTYLKTSLN